MERGALQLRCPLFLPGREEPQAKSLSYTGCKLDFASNLLQIEEKRQAQRYAHRKGRSYGKPEPTHVKAFQRYKAEQHHRGD